MTKDREQQMLKASQLYPKHQQKVFVDGALWADRNPQNLWHDAQGDALPKIGRKVIVLCADGYLGYKVCFAHRPNPKGWMGIVPKTYGKGGWGIPDVKWWLDLEIPKEEQQ